MAHSGEQWSTIETERLLLRKSTIQDTDAIANLRTNPAVFYWRTPDTREAAIEWLKNRLGDPNDLTYTARLKSAPDVVIGSLGAAPLPEVGYVYDPSVWGKGYATEALRAWIDMYWKRYSEGHPGLEGDNKNCLGAETGSEDPNSPRVLKKCGFRFVRQVQVVEEGKDAALDYWRLDRPV